MVPDLAGDLLLKSIDGLQYLLWFNHTSDNQTKIFRAVELVMIVSHLHNNSSPSTY